tara:strand:+ start:6479 stop:6886 length:408 start_codon:yes stop_codon:yes gene_type:complete
MKKDIVIPKVEGVHIAVVQEDVGEGVAVWNVYLINNKEDALENAFVSSRGYLKEVDGKESKTSTLRHYFKHVPAKSSLKVEPIMPDVFKLNNEFFVSFYLNDKLFDKKFVFLSETIKESNLAIVPVIDKKGVWIK